MSRRGAMRPILELDVALKGSEEPKEVVENFLAEHTFPLVDEDTAVFFFEGSRVDQVYLVHWVFGLESRQPLLQLGESDCWYLPVELPRGARVEYKFELVRGGRSHWVRDPQNPLRAFDPFGSNSVCAMTGYTEPEWVQPAVESRQGRMVEFNLTSTVYGDVRPISVYLPAEYKPHKKYPLVICHDGADYLRFAQIRDALDTLIARHEVAPLLVAFTSGVARNTEYGANPLQPEFLVREVLPAVQARFGVSEKREDLGLMGASFGAVSSLYCAHTHPEVFGKLLLQSGSFVFTDIGRHDRGPLFDPVVDFINDFRSDVGRVDAKIFLSCGTFESLIWFNRGLRPLMEEAGLQVKFVEAADGHNWIAWRDRLRDGLSYLFPGHLWMTYD